MDIRVNDSHRIIIGDTDYRRGSRDEPWRKFSWGGSPFQWPKAYYRSFWHDAAAVRVLGTERMKSERFRIVSFLRPNLPAWFRLWLRVSDEAIDETMHRVGAVG